MIKNITLLLVISLLFNISRLSADVCTASGGDWGIASTWSCGHVPNANDNIIIPNGVEVTISTSLNYDEPGDLPTNITVLGTLRFNPPTGCSGNGCSITLWLAASSQIYVDQPDGLYLGVNGVPGQTYIIIGGDNVLHSNGNNGFPFGPGTLPLDAPLPVELSAFYGTAMERSNVIKLIGP